MLSDFDLRALLSAQHPDPFAVLGLHADAQGRLWLRSLLPGARSVIACDPRGRRLAVLDERAPGFFEGLVPRRRKRFDYRLRVQWVHGDETLLADA